MGKRREFGMRRATRRACCPGTLAVLLAIALVAPASAQAPAASAAQCAGAAAPEQRDLACAAILRNPALPPKDAALTHYFRGFAMRDLNQGDAALAEFSEATKLDPELWPANWVRAELLTERRSYDKAAAAWSQVIQRYPDLASPYAHRADALDEQGRRAEAQGDYTKAIELARSKDPLAEFYMERAVSYEGDRQFDKALADYGEAIKRDDHLARAYYGRGRVEFLRGDMGTAAADLTKAFDGDPKDYYPLLWLYLAQARGGKDAPAELRRRASQLDLAKWPGPIIQVFLGDTAAEKVQPPHEPAAWSEAEQKAGGNCELSFYVGELRLAKGERARAVALFKTAVDSGIGEYIEYVSASYELDRAGR